jgi:hypothetical protein
MNLAKLNTPLFEIPGFDHWVDRLKFDATLRDIALSLYRDGFAVLKFPDPDFDQLAERVKSALHPVFAADAPASRGGPYAKGRRVQDAWAYNEDVRRIAVNERILDILSRVFGRQAWPFQTLNFPTGTQQHFHSDAIHFHCIPARFMCGVWVALEDVDETSGPLVYYPGSHKWPIASNDDLAIAVAGQKRGFNQEVYHDYWEAMVEASGVAPAYFCPKKGEALIWSANLLHGGAVQKDPKRTRWSQVTHYYFEDCSYYTPMYSNPAAGLMEWRRELVDIRTKQPVRPSVSPAQSPAQQDPRLPTGFNPRRYLELNPDVAAAGADPVQHFLNHGYAEGRRYA